MHDLLPFVMGYDKAKKPNYTTSQLQCFLFASHVRPPWGWQFAVFYPLRTGRGESRIKLQVRSRKELDDAAADGDRHRLRAVSGVQLVHDVLHMGLDSFLGDEQLRADLPIP